MATLERGSITVGDTGTEMLFAIQDQSDAYVDIRGQTVTARFERPDGTTFDRPTTEATAYDGTDTAITAALTAHALVRYVLVEGDIDQDGTWRVRAHVTTGGSGSWKSTKDRFTVDADLAEPVTP